MNFDLIESKRVEKRYTVTALCKQIGIDRSSYYYFKNNPDNMKLTVLNKLIEVLELSKSERNQLIS